MCGSGSRILNLFLLLSSKLFNFTTSKFKLKIEFTFKFEWCESQFHSCKKNSIAVYLRLNFLLMILFIFLCHILCSTIRFNKMMLHLDSKRSPADTSKTILCFREFIKVRYDPVSCICYHNYDILSVIE